MPDQTQLRTLLIIGGVFLLTALLSVGCGGDGDNGSPLTQTDTDGGQVDVGPADADSGVCEPGQQGCACQAGDQCGTNAFGEALSCVGGVCEAPTCVSGDRGCVCRSGSTCDNGADTCRSGFCQPTDCMPGEEFCGCAGGSCNPGLFCQNGSICVDSAGQEGGECLSNGSCHRGNRCEPTANICVHCELGSPGCHCNDQSSCFEGLACTAGRCVEASAFPPQNPSCYSPCRNDIELDDGTLRRCNADGLMK
jgi:hypothetical protein